MGHDFSFCYVYDHTLYVLTMLLQCLFKLALVIVGLCQHHFV
jgi:hypothetical protein